MLLPVRRTAVCLRVPVVALRRHRVRQDARASRRSTFSRARRRGFLRRLRRRSLGASRCTGVRPSQLEGRFGQSDVAAEHGERAGEDCKAFQHGRSPSGANRTAGPSPHRAAHRATADGAMLGDDHQPESDAPITIPSPRSPRTRPMLDRTDARILAPLDHEKLAQPMAKQHSRRKSAGRRHYKYVIGAPASSRSRTLRVQQAIRGIIGHAQSALRGRS